MIIEVKKLHGLTLHALDGEIGKVDELLFDDEFWIVRYLVVDTGTWLFNRKVLISPMALGLVEREAQTLMVNLNRQQIKNSPGVEFDKPVSRQWEKSYADYYASPYYWNGVSGSAVLGVPLGQTANEAEAQQQQARDQAHVHDDVHLRSTKEVTGYKISATDGHLGHVQDFLVNDATWRICYLVVDTRDWWPSQPVLLPPEWTSEVDWPGRNVSVKVTRDQVKGAPQWDQDQPINLRFEELLYAYYDNQHPWEKEKPMETIDKTRSSSTSTFVAIYDTHREAETAIRDLQKLGFDMTKLSIVGKDYHSEEEVVGYYNAGDRMKAWGKTGAFWGGIWSLMFGSAFFLVPGIGPILAAGPIVAWIVGALESAVVVGGISALGGALFSIGIPNDRIISYEKQIKAGKFVVIAHGIEGKQEKAMIALEASKHQYIDQHFTPIEPLEATSA